MRYLYSFFLFPALIVALLAAACGTDSGGGGEDTRTDQDVVPDADWDGSGGCTPGHVYCEGTIARTCADDGKSYVNEVNCADSGMICTPGIGCTVCSPGESVCDGNVPQRCRPDGSGWDTLEPCGGETVCRNGACINLCEEARGKNSYIGCDYWAVPTANSQLSTDFEFAVAVANPQDVDAVLTITNGGGYNDTVTVPPQSLQTVVLPYLPTLKMEYQSEASIIDPNGAYSIRSSVPVTVYQFNPLEYMLDHNCTDSDQDPLDGKCYSYTNDASLLLPEHVLSGNYIVVSRPTMTIQRMGQLSNSPGYVAITAVKPGTTNVDVDFTCRTIASGDGGIRAYGRGETGSFTLEQYNVLQLISDLPTTCVNPGTSDSGGTYCNNGYEYDFSGSRVTASQPVAVFSGHNCTFVPYDRWACDHLEEQMFPLEAWGKQYVVTRAMPMFTDSPEPNIWKLVSGKDANVITFDPPSVNPEITLNAGEWVEFEAWENFKITGSEGFMVTQFMVGMNYFGVDQASENGDPAMCLAVPYEQYRDEYTFLAPLTYEMSYVNITIRSGLENTVMLDGFNPTGWTPVGSSGFVSTMIDVVGGTHTITADDVFGIIVYGVGDYTSYMYPGGLDLEEIFVI